MIELGTLVLSVDDGVMGIITWVDNNPYDEPLIYQVTWVDGLKGLHTTDEFEVIA